MKLFTYGILMNADTMGYTVDWQAELVGPATLHGHQLELRGPANIEFVEGARVDGVVWEIPDNPLLWFHLDRLESGYSRITVKAVLKDGTPVDCFAYTMNWMLGRNDDFRMSESLRESYRKHGLDESLLDEAVERVNEEESEPYYKPWRLHSVIDLDIT